MLRAVALCMFLVPTFAVAQTASDGMPIMSPGNMDHMKMHAQMSGAFPTESGQSAFAAIQEIVEALNMDPSTDWSKVDIEALRRHLIDMDNVTLRSEVKAEPVDGGMRFTVTGAGDVVGSIQRMTSAHAMTMGGVGGWQYETSDIPDGAIVIVKVPPTDMAKLSALSFIGVMTLGMHHQQHHLAIALGQHPHG